ncbi:MAG TPA: TonB-dependent receptor plug domain-containing protein, partial [Gemmatimonadales bacterium]|nr:TonB-dependent receptor plug domain-containing protein [Gemmatimonadales bacterium]
MTVVPRAIRSTWLVCWSPIRSTTWAIAGGLLTARPCGLVGALLFVPALLLAQQPSPRDLASLDLEELAKIKVTSASRKPESLGTVAASLYILTRDDIRRSAATSLPELLRRVPGLQVARATSRDWAIGARGFNNTSSDKLLVLVDGRAIYSPIFA